MKAVSKAELEKLQDIIKSYFESLHCVGQLDPKDISLELLNTYLTSQADFNSLKTWSYPIMNQQNCKRKSELKLEQQSSLDYWISRFISLVSQYSDQNLFCEIVIMFELLRRYFIKHLCNMDQTNLTIQFIDQNIGDLESILTEFVFKFPILCKQLEIKQTFQYLPFPSKNEKSMETLLHLLIYFFAFLLHRDLISHRLSMITPNALNTSKIIQ